MLNHPDTERSNPSSSKLVLPDLSDEEQRVSSGQQRAQFNPNLLIRQKTPPAPEKVLPKLAWYWRKDPAYKVFMIALAMVVLASIVLVSLVSASIFGRSSSSVSYSSTPPAKVVPNGPVDLHPAFPTPNGGNGTGVSSQPPTQNTPSIGSQPTATVQPGVLVYLQIHYNAQPARANAGPGTTDGTGSVTIPWSVFVFSFNRKNVQATLTAIATDQNGQQVSSNPVVIQVLLGPGVG